MEESKSRDISGTPLGGFLPLYRLPERTRDGEEQWMCRCLHCGREKALRRGNIRKTKSCGCLTEKKMEQQAEEIAGKKFGRLTALAPMDQKVRYDGQIWRWRCDCGQEVDHPLRTVRRGHVQSCGCDRWKDLAGQRFGRLSAIRPTEERYRKQGVWYNMENNEVQLSEKYALTIPEASAYFGIGEKKLRSMVEEYRHLGLFLHVGVKCLVKRDKFENFLDEMTEI